MHHRHDQFTSPLSRPQRTRESVVTRLRRAIAEAELACDCRQAAEAALDRADTENDLLRRAEGLADARRMRDAIVLVLALLGDLDELLPDEPDRSAFEAIADLFQDVRDFATYGALATRRAAAHGEML